jgi:phenylphosphate carboxylase gamma subunit
MNQWEVFVMDMGELAEGKDIETQHPHPQPRHAQVHLQARASAQVSSTWTSFPTSSRCASGRGQLSPAKFSIKVIEEIQRLPPQYLIIGEMQGRRWRRGASADFSGS